MTEHTPNACPICGQTASLFAGGEYWGFCSEHGIKWLIDSRASFDLDDENPLKKLLHEVFLEGLRDISGRPDT